MKGQPNPRRAELAKLSGAFRPLVKAGKFPNVNAAVLAYYKQQTGHETWHTFKGWQESGFSVVKGSTGFPIWATPRHMAVPEGTRLSDLQVVGAMQGVEPQGPEWFPVCYLFHDGQVQAIEPVKAAA